MKNDDLHLIGICCMFISSKYEEKIPLSLNSIYKTIGFEKFTKE